jgi:hypothetical protein
VLAPLVALACQGATETVQLPFVLDTAPVAAGTFPDTIHVDGERVVVRGIVGTPDPCHSFAARAVTRADTLDLRLEARSAGVPCIQIVGRFRYELSVQDVPPGTWWVRLDTSLRGSSMVTPLVAGAVNVP